MAQDEYVRILFGKYLEGTHTGEELDALLRYFDVDGDASIQLTELIEHALSSPVSEADASIARVAAIRDRVAARLPLARPRTIRKWLPYAAAVLLVASVVGYFVVDSRRSSVDGFVASEILPGGNRATLTLADGRTIDLDEAQTGIIVGAEDITYDDGSVVSPADSPYAGHATYDLQLATPKGGTYQITLPDGSKVWLNSASTLRYPSRFSGNERIVELSGEAFFDIQPQVGVRTGGRNVEAHNYASFNVRTAGQEVVVLGTQFNISAYPDEPDTKTTLVEGKVKVTPGTQNGSSVSGLRSSDHVLQPGEQAITRGTQIEIREVDAEQFIAWKSGKFLFKTTPFRDMIAQVARWYDIEVVYETQVPTNTFSGDMKRSVSLATVLDMLEISNIPFRIEGKKLIIE